ncbi:hypothetical protein C8N36_12348 [Pelagimonas varians]|uniref:Uncharacterized protein n=1 Tax=Pelagimonas varians TaxID=696760 RepID=A0A238L4F7_9RHOB|nr:hypothetical protein C8N36_12348 [Pelagimonas varians]SMX49954.1 hypothetical protein PEV8663_04406 [Pelagimonas varians]
MIETSLTVNVRLVRLADLHHQNAVPVRQRLVSGSCTAALDDLTSGSSGPFVTCKLMHGPNLQSPLSAHSSR